MGKKYVYIALVFFVFVFGLFVGYGELKQRREEQAIQKHYALIETVVDDIRTNSCTGKDYIVDGDEGLWEDLCSFYHVYLESDAPYKIEYGNSWTEDYNFAEDGFVDQSYVYGYVFETQDFDMLPSKILVSESHLHTVDFGHTSKKIDDDVHKAYDEFLELLSGYAESSGFSEEFDRSSKSILKNINPLNCEDVYDTSTTKDFRNRFSKNDFAEFCERFDRYSSNNILTTRYRGPRFFEDESNVPEFENGDIYAFDSYNLSADAETSSGEGSGRATLNTVFIREENGTWLIHSMNWLDYSDLLYFSKQFNEVSGPN